MKYNIDYMTSTTLNEEQNVYTVKLHGTKNVM